MSEHRRPVIPFSDAPRGTCRWCGEAILYTAGAKAGELDRRRRWHPGCVEIYNATDPREARRIVRKRDRGICAACGLDTRRLAREVKGSGRARSLRKLGFKVRSSLWELDHVVPLVDGGGFELANLQTLCTPCHKRKTADEARARALRRSSDVATACVADGGGVRGLAATPARLARTGDDPLARDLDRLLEAAGAANARAEALLGALDRD